MAPSNIPVLCFVSLYLCVVCFVAGFAMGDFMGRQKFEKEAIGMGVANWEFVDHDDNPTTPPNVSFVWATHQD